MNRSKKISVIFCVLFVLLNGVQGAPHYGSSSTFQNHYEQHQETVESARQNSGITSFNSHIHAVPGQVDCTLCSSSGGLVHGGSNSMSSGSSSFMHGSSSGNLALSHVPSRIIYTPSTGSSGFSESHLSESQKVIKSQNVAPVRLITVGGSGGSSESHVHQREQHIHSQSQLPVSSSLIVLPSNNLQVSGSSSHDSLDLISQYPSIYVAPSGGSSMNHEVNSKYVKSVETASVPIVTLPARVTSSSSGRYVESHSTNSGSSSGVVVPVSTTYGGGSLASSSNRYVEGHSTNSGGMGVVFPSSSGTHFESSGRHFGLSGSQYDSSGSHFGLSGSHVLDESAFGQRTSSLDRYISESERLARLQAANIHNSGSVSGGSIINHDFEGNNLGIGVSTGSNGSGGYKKSHSWEKSSKWASGSSYGTGQSPNSYNYLSTAEKEQQDINGRKAGYAAATTTLDDNGKVSTYTIHTP